MKTAIIILLGLAFLLNSIVLGWIYPDVSKDYYVFVKYAYARFRWYDCMIAGLFWVGYILSEKLEKALFCFFMMLAFGSVVDKLFFGITHYLQSDIVLIIVSLAISIRLYVREYKR